ncbi:hypothetical protein CUN85_06390 [Methanolobus halotolerans]|uniref:Uncharacterized protein n=2 Tax=Methanolobus halotolerans TaxID=2052935 RepID=A0A4E0PW11_9EURY|nr:hypothetical protein CUN85_06390 [Methanolobus halotolerans]
MNGNNHGWSEVQLDNGNWVIGDAGFGLAPPEDNQSFFYSERDLLLGPIYFVENDTYIDNMELYVPNTQKITIHTTKMGEDFNDGLIYVLLHYKDKSRGMWLPYQTNESGLAEVNLGIYDGVTYTIGVMNPVATDYAESEISLGHDSNVASIKLDDWKFSKVVINGVLVVLWCIVYIGIIINDRPSEFTKMGNKVGGKLMENRYMNQQIQRRFRKKH